MTDVVALPTSGDAAQWTEGEKALVEAAGLTSGTGQNKHFAPRPVVEAFLLHCRRTGLDPIARQIYCIERGGKWGTQVSIDGARLVAERTGQYRGQTPTQWTADGVTWTDVWLSERAPAAARVGVLREGFSAPLFAVATWKEYAIANGQMWKKMPALMLGKVAEMLALRKAFPQDLSGLYSTEEMAQAGTPAPETKPGAAGGSAPRQQQPAPAEVVASRDWKKAIDDAETLEALSDVSRDAQNEGQLSVLIDVDGVQLTVLQYGLGRKADLSRATEAPAEESPDEPAAPEAPAADADSEPADVPRAGDVWGTPAVEKTKAERVEELRGMTWSQLRQVAESDYGLDSQASAAVLRVRILEHENWDDDAEGEG